MTLKDNTLELCHRELCSEDTMFMPTLAAGHCSDSLESIPKLCHPTNAARIAYRVNCLEKVLISLSISSQQQRS